jgi:hypothetical protein
LIFLGEVVGDLFEIDIFGLELAEDGLVDHGVLSLLVLKIVAPALQLIEEVLGLECGLDVADIDLEGGIVEAGDLVGVSGH